MSKDKKVFLIVVAVFSLYVCTYWVNKSILYTHKVEITFGNGNKKVILVTTEDDYVNNDDITTYRVSNPLYAGYIDVFDVRMIETVSKEEQLDKRIVESIFLLPLVCMLLGLIVLMFYGAIDVVKAIINY
jgi:hypothetical protein